MKTNSKLLYVEKEAEFTKECVRHFLDALHAIDISIDCPAEMMMLIKFIQFEGKSGRDLNQS